jgi:glycosyltransferase involved in cell wall biosynthesis
MNLSIIIPVYNVENYLSKCLDSVIYPDIPDYEIIIVNDGSTDSSELVAKDYVNRYPQLIRLITTPNGGLGAARNVGLEAASGEFLLFLDSDDWLCENAVPEIMEKLKEDFDICIYGILSVTEDGTVLDDVRSCHREGSVALKAFPQLLLAPPSGCNKLCRRSLFIDNDLRFPCRVWYEDLRTMPKLYLYTDKIVATDRQWYIYLRRSGSIINSANLQRNLEIIDAVEDLCSYYKAHDKYDTYRSELEYIAFFNQFLTASVRVCQADPKSPVLPKLVDSFLRDYPDFMSNKYVMEMPKKYKLLSYLISHKHYSAVKHIMDLNDRSKHK